MSAVVGGLLTGCDQRESSSNNTSIPSANISSDSIAITAKEAKNYIGLDSIVTGTISEVFISRQSTNVYMYLDGDMKNAQFAAVWSGTNDPPLTRLEGLIARTVSIKGKITSERGLPVIIVNSWDQIHQQ